MKLLITGAAGFIGMYVAKKFLDRGDSVVGVDSLNDYYDVSLKLARLKELEHCGSNFRFLKMDISDRSSLQDLFKRERFDKVINLAAQAGVRYSILNPAAYIDSNLVGFGNVLECCRHNEIQHLVYASSSSVYGGNTKMPFAETDAVDRPVSLYAATKKANELMAHTYSHLYSLPTTGLRFFTVYGPWGRPDMAPFLFVSAILKREKIKVFNYGDMCRDFTYVDDIAEGVMRAVDRNATSEIPNEDAGGVSHSAPYRVFNIGNSAPIPLMDFIGHVENSLGAVAEKEFLPMQDGDVPATYADTSALEQWVSFTPTISIEIGVQRFVDWYRTYYNI